jgi:hypothetical protein
MTVPKYRMRAVEIAKEEGLLGANNKKKGGKKISKVSSVSLVFSSVGNGNKCNTFNFHK